MGADKGQSGAGSTVTHLTFPLRRASVDTLLDRDSVVVRPAGDLGRAAVEAVDDVLAALRATRFDRVAMDLTRVGALDATGVRALLAWSLRAAADGSVFRVRRAPPHIERVLAMEGARSVLGAPG